MSGRHLTPSSSTAEETKLPHVRSPESLQRRAAKHYIMKTAYYDRINSDTVCLKSNEDVTAFLCDQFLDGVILGVVQVVRGEVVTDARGNGSFQKQVEV